MSGVWTTTAPFAWANFGRISACTDSLASNVTMAAAPDPSPVPSADPRPSSKARTFFRRLGSSITLWSFVLAALFAGNIHIEGFNARLLSDILFLIVMLVIAALGLEEFYELIEKAGYACFRGWGITGG